MTYGIKTVIGVMTKINREGFFGTKQPLFGQSWKSTKLLGSWTLDDVWTYLIGAHLSHLLDFLVAFVAYLVFFADGSWKVECAEWGAGWVAKVLGFNLVCEILFTASWHWLTYMSDYAKGMEEFKFNRVNQYEPKGGRVGCFRSSSGHLEREIMYTTLGWLQSGAWQCLLTWAWASGRLPMYTDFWSRPFFSVGLLMAVTFWREVHFYWCHRAMHPWWDRKNGLMNGDIGAFLYRHAHSLHHKSYNPGPWSGLSMHPIEHFLYYSCAWAPPMLMAVHPLHFLYAKFHADIAPIGGHDGYNEPSANGDFHYLHHSKYECNYGVPWPINFDKMFNTWLDYKEYVARKKEKERESEK